MMYVLLVVVVVFVLFSAWRENEASKERRLIIKTYHTHMSELLTRISHPELVVVPENDVPKVAAPDVDPEPDGYNDVGTIVE
jgi:uncharacterized protein involved in tolerance to divalent cations